MTDCFDRERRPLPPDIGPNLAPDRFTAWMRAGCSTADERYPAVRSEAAAPLPTKPARPEMTARQIAWCRSKWPWFDDNRRVVRVERGGAA